MKPSKLEKKIFYYVALPCWVFSPAVLSLPNFGMIIVASMMFSIYAVLIIKKIVTDETKQTA